MCSAEVPIRSCSKRPTRVGPAEGFGEHVVEVIDKRRRAGAQVVERGEAGAVQQTPRQDGETDFGLVQPRAVVRRVDEANPVGRVLQELPASLLRFEDAGLALGAEVILDTAPTSNELDERCGTVRVELIGDEDPACFWIGLDGLVGMGDEISVRSGRSDRRADYL